MKKVLLIGAVAVAGLISAQTSFGLKAGYTQSVIDITGDNLTVSSDGKSSFYVGGLVEYKLPNRFALQGELLFSPQGGTISESASGAGYAYSYKSDITLTTLQVPVALKYYVADQFAFTGGVNFGFILSGKEDWNSSGTSYVENETLLEFGNGDIEDLNKLNLAPFVGAEYNLTNKLFFDARYNFGISNLYGEKNRFPRSEVKMSFFQVGLGYKF